MSFIFAASFSLSLPYAGPIPTTTLVARQRCPAQPNALSTMFAIDFSQSQSSATAVKFCGATGKRVQALGGAKNFTAVADDCDWEKSIANIVDSAFGCAGQRCLATSVVVGIGPAYAKLKEKLAAKMKDIKVGYGMEPGVTMGPVISAAHRTRVLGYIEKGIKEGAELVVDGRNCKV